MKTLNIKDLNDKFNSIEELDKEILKLKKILLDLRVTKKTYQLKKPHQFKQYRKRIAQLNFLKNNLNFND